MFNIGKTLESLFQRGNIMSYILKVNIEFEDGDTCELSNRDIVSITSSENMTDANVSYLPGVCEQYANVVLYDRNNALHERAMQNKSMDGILSIYMFNTSIVDPAPVLVDSFDISDCKIESDNSDVEINCRDRTYVLDNLYVPEAENAGRTIHTLLSNVFDTIPNASWEYQDVETRVRCQTIFIQNSWYKSGVLRALLNKICVVGMLRIYYKKGVYYVGRCL